VYISICFVLDEPTYETDDVNTPNANNTPQVGFTRNVNNTPTLTDVGVQTSNTYTNEILLKVLIKRK